MDIIRKTLVQIRQRLNEYFRNQYDRFSMEKRDWVVLSNLVSHDGTPCDGAKKKLVMFLANIQHETTISTFNRTRPIQNKGAVANQQQLYAAEPPPLYIDLYLLLIANYENSEYEDGLTAISTAISFFQQYPVFNHQNLPNLDSQIDKLTFEMTNLDVMQMNYLMGLAGTKYLPSVYYKIRMLPFQSSAIKGTVPALKGLRAPAEPDDSPLPLRPGSFRAELAEGDMPSEFQEGG